MALKTISVARQWLIVDHVVTATDTNATMGTIEDGVFYEALAEMLYAGSDVLLWRGELIGVLENCRGPVVVSWCC
jgi:hypothetical protein